MLDFRLLTFLDLCHSKSFTKTAENLNITQPAVSQHIKYLEQYYGVKLVLYQNRNFSLTREGEYLLKEITKLRLLSTSIRKNIKNISDTHKNPNISIGSDPTIGEFILPDLISAYTAKNPSCKIRSFIGTSRQLEKKLRNGGIDFLITDSAELWSEMEHQLFCRESICCICNPQHPLAQKTVPLAQLKKENITYRERSSHAYEVLKHSFWRLGYNLDDYDISFETGSMHSIIQYLKSSLAISFLYQCATRKYIDTGELSEIYVPEMQDYIEFYCVYPQKNNLSEAADSFLQFCFETKLDNY